MDEIKPEGAIANGIRASPEDIMAQKMRLAATVAYRQYILDWRERVFRLEREVWEGRPKFKILGRGYIES